MKQAIRQSLLVAACLTASTQSHAFYIDGEGHYSLQAITRTNPGFQQDRGLFQATKQNFRLNGEIRANDKASFFLRLGLFDNPSAAYLGDKAEPAVCPKKRTDTSANPTYSNDCSSDPQNTSSPGYSAYTPKIHEAYARYATDSCIIEAGRRPRHWGNGVFLNSGTGAYDESQSVFDGISCIVNLQKFETVQFSIGFDKLAETGASLDNPYYSRFPIGDGSENSYDSSSQGYGAASSGDDLEQFFVTIELNDQATSKPGEMVQNIGMYASRVQGKNSSTDLTFIDLYTNLYFSSFSFKNELLFSIGQDL